MKSSTMKYKCLCCRALFIWIRTGSWEADIHGWCKMSIIWNRINKHGGANNKRKCWPFQVNKAWLISEWLIGLVYSILIVIDSPFSFSSTCFTPNICMHILHTVLYTFHKVLTRRICLTIKSFFSWWSFPLLW